MIQHSILVGMEADMIQRLKAVCKRRGVTMSSAIRWALSRQLEKEEAEESKNEIC